MAIKDIFNIFNRQPQPKISYPTERPFDPKSIVKNAIADEIKNGIKIHEEIKNGLGNAIGFPNVNGFGGGQGSNPFAPQVEQVNTLFENLRWYLVSNMRQPLSQAYVELGLVQTVIDVPVDDALRGGIKIQSKQLSEEQIHELQVSVDRDDDLNTVGQAAKWNRLYGGAGVLILVGDQDPKEELDIESINPKTSLEFRAVDMWELFWDKQNTEGYDPQLQAQDFEFYSYYSENVHKSRVMRMKGREAPSFLRPRLRGWGFSEVEPLIRSINQYLKATDLGFAVMDEFKVDIYKIKNLVNTLMSPQGEQAIKQRIAMANWQKNYQNALVMDSEDDWEAKQISFAGLAETMQGIRMQVAADMRMPITKLFGTSASAGIGNTDQNDMENYNSMVESQVRNKIKYDILRLLEIKCQKLFGMIPEDLEIEFKPLRVLSAEQEENVKTQIFNRVMAAKGAGEIDSRTFIEACNAAKLLPVQLDPAVDLLNPSDSDIADEGENNPDKPNDVDDPGANREDRRKPSPWEMGGISKAPISKAINSSSNLKMKYRDHLINLIHDGMGCYNIKVDGIGDGDVGIVKENQTHQGFGAGKKFIDEYLDSASKFKPLNDPKDKQNDDENSYKNPGKVDEGLWAKAKAQCLKEYGEMKYPVVTAIYKKLGGTFS